MKTPLPVLATYAVRFEIGDHCGRPCSLERRFAVGTVEAHHPDDPGVQVIVTKCPEIAQQVTRHDGAVPAPGIEGWIFPSSNRLLPMA